VLPIFKTISLSEGEHHYSAQVAIDRLTGKVLDKQIEVVNE